ncbi:MAG: 16S rRNA (uracil(1498)-N(3))-methyltransferase [Acaryochloridaceae cyanobacterium SU_2_1]|nr:16S rRNA (uracil(1498)-N(3))-methyltransferase [Acaryochloridaceae cyanobacterium SU_2_1]
MTQLQHLAISPAQFTDQIIALNREQQHYLQTVMRLKKGDRFIAINGLGQAWLTELQNNSLAKLLQPLTLDTELAMPVVLMAAPPKGNQFDAVVRASTEMGITHLIPLLSERTLLKPSLQRIERWRRIATEAAEHQDGNSSPELAIQSPLWRPVSLLGGDGDQDLPWQKYICTLNRPCPSLWTCLTQRADVSAVAVMVGPEGGWTAPEVDQAQALGCQPVSLGHRTLRAVTAACHALSLVIAHQDALPS